MRTRAIPRLLAALSVVVLLAAACGDDDTTAGTDPAPPGDDAASPDHDAEPDADHDAEVTDADMTDDSGDGHDHGEIVAVAADGAPAVDLEVFADPAGGVDIHVRTENFTPNPRAASTEHVDGEGHFHLYIDGEKVLRFYNEWIHYAGVVEGDVDIAVGLSANDHRSYAVDGEEIRASVEFTVPAHAHDAHSHGDPVAVDFVGAAPTIDVEVVEDPKSGWNAFITLDGMVLSAENASSDHVDGEGHLHLYANGQKLGRLYGLATHIPALPDGDVEISVVAYANDHSPYVIDGQPISAAVTVGVDA